MKRTWPVLFMLVCALFVYPSFVRATTGSILSGHSSAWSNNIGWVNFSQTTVTDSSLTGYAWSQNNGWINMAPTQSGVVNDGSGNLSGYAWGESVGWINFSGVSIDTNGNFSGTASGSLIGTLTFECTYCDVQTDWRVRTEEETPPQASGGGGGFVPSQVPPTSLDAYDEDLVILPGQSGVATRSTTLGPITLSVPVGAVSERTTFHIGEKRTSPDTILPKGFFPVNGAVYTIDAKTDNQDAAHTFLKPLRIMFPLAPDVQDLTHLSVYWQDDVSQSWQRVSGVAFAQYGVTFEVNHLTTFVILRGEAPAPIEEPTVPVIDVEPPTYIPAWPREESVVDIDVPGAHDVTIIFDTPQFEESGAVDVTFVFPVTSTTDITVTYEIVNQQGDVMYTQQEELIVDKDQSYNKSFFDLGLPVGEYTLNITTQYGDATSTVRQSSKTFIITATQGEEQRRPYGWWGWIISILIGIIVVWVIKRIENKREASS